MNRRILLAVVLAAVVFPCLAGPCERAAGLLAEKRPDDADEAYAGWIANLWDEVGGCAAQWLGAHSETGPEGLVEHLQGLGPGEDLYASAVPLRRGGEVGMALALESGCAG